MKELILGLLGFILFIVIVLAILFHKTLSQFRKMLKQAADAREARRMAEEEEYFKRTSTKHYWKDEEAPKFKDDYFKSSNTEGKPKQKPRQEPRRTTSRQNAKSSTTTKASTLSLKKLSNF